ncbi:MAG: hypothetical protein KDD41_00580 [Flavobacteriales bacterium]|nr:hypothetical protein [Flavobacteriales bacterium]
MNFFLSLLIFSVISAEPASGGQQTVQEVQETPIKESLFITMERTPCLGRCPSYKISIFNTGKILYEGYDFVEHQGTFQGQLSPVQLNDIRAKMDEIKIFALQNKYDSPITDIPSCLLYINDGEQKKKIYDRHGAPESLKEFEKLIDTFVSGCKLSKVKTSK